MRPRSSPIDEQGRANGAGTRSQAAGAGGNTGAAGEKTEAACTSTALGAEASIAALQQDAAMPPHLHARLDLRRSEVEDEAAGCEIGRGGKGLLTHARCARAQERMEESLHMHNLRLLGGNLGLEQAQSQDFRQSTPLARVYDPPSPSSHGQACSQALGEWAESVGGQRGSEAVADGRMVSVSAGALILSHCSSCPTARGRVLCLASSPHSSALPPPCPSIFSHSGRHQEAAMKRQGAWPRPKAMRATA